MDSLQNDKSTERDRYDSRSQKALLEGVANASGADSIDMVFRRPYILYEKHIATYIKPHHKVLELGSGSGLHTEALLKTGANVTASDIAPSSLALLRKTLFPVYGEKLTTQIADIESLPFGNESFDVITCAGSLSYGDPELVNREIKRVLKSGGIFICVDSLNHNPVYRFNRYMHYKRGQRTASTLERIPDMKRINRFKEMFDSVDVSFFGSLTWAAPIFRKILGQDNTAKFLEAFDRFIKVKRSAFKFVLIAR